MLRIELVAALACTSGNEFAEGVRALIIDKDMQPQWLPATLAEISEDELSRRFFPTPWSAQEHPLRDLEIGI